MSATAPPSFSGGLSAPPPFPLSLTPGLALKNNELEGANGTPPRRTPTGSWVLGGAQLEGADLAMRVTPREGLVPKA